MVLVLVLWILPPHSRLVHTDKQPNPNCNSPQGHLQSVSRGSGPEGNIWKSWRSWGVTSFRCWNFFFFYVDRNDLGLLCLCHCQHVLQIGGRFDPMRLSRRKLPLHVFRCHRIFKVRSPEIHLQKIPLRQAFCAIW